MEITMFKKIFTITVALLIGAAALAGRDAHAGNVPVTFNHWLYLNGNIAFSPSWSLHVMPGHSYEYWSDEKTGAGSHPKGTFLTELFIGPWYSTALTDNLKMRLGVEYYYMGFSLSHSADVIDFYNHCIEVIPVFDYKINDKFSISSRTIFHNVLYTSDRKSRATDESSSGWGMLVRQLVTVHYNLNQLVTLSLGNEFFFGVVEGDGLISAHKNTKGYNENRVIPGITLKNLAPGFSLTANYIYRTSFQMHDSATFDKGDINKVQHYAQLIASYTFKTF
jgi:hypothetical protein